jgi:hypothetical protein
MSSSDGPEDLSITDGSPHYVDYTNGTTDFFTIGSSGWTTGYDGGTTTAAWESIAASMSSYNSSSGSQATPTYLYGYVLPVNPNLTVQDLRAPNNNNIRILAIDVVNQPVQANLGNIANSVTPPDNVEAVTPNAAYSGNGVGIDGSGDTYSLSAIGGSTVNWNAESFNVGPGNIVHR